MSSTEEIEHRKVKSLKQVDVVAWIILLTISIECFIGKSSISKDWIRKSVLYVQSWFN